MIPRETVEPFYFGTPARQLFGCYHQPPRRPLRGVVVLCQPIGHEYINSHRALSRLASRLCGEGFATLRFDYYGCGDSAGNVEDARIGEWLDNISMAVAEAKCRSRANQVCLVGLRLGATLSLMASERSKDIDKLVLWDPVVNGQDYLAGLIALRKEMLGFRPTSKQHLPKDYTDILGFPLSRFLYADLESVSLNRAPISGTMASNILFLQTGQLDGQNGLVAHLRKAEIPCEHLCLNDPKVWLPTENGSLLVPVQTLNAITTWLSGTHS